MPTKIWNDWKIEDGDYIAEHNKPLKNSFFVNADSTTLLLVIGAVILSVVLLAVILI